MIFTPGHAPGHLCFYFENISYEIDWVDQGIAESGDGPLLVAGDALFRGSIGRTDLPGSNHDELISSIKTKLFSLPDQTVVLSGHGPNTVIGLEKETNPFLT